MGEEEAGCCFDCAVIGERKDKLALKIRDGLRRKWLRRRLIACVLWWRWKARNVLEAVDAVFPVLVFRLV
jgi:hypothetical protein